MFTKANASYIHITTKIIFIVKKKDKSISIPNATRAENDNE